MSMQTRTSTTHVIRVSIKKKVITILDSLKEVNGGDRIRWENIHDKEPFFIVFKYNNNKNNNGNGKESPFTDEELTYDGATADRPAEFGGRFKYTLILECDHHYKVDPVVVVDPPNYPY